MKGNKNHNRHEFLLTFFDQEQDHYEEKKVNGFWLVKQWNGGTKAWQVAIFPQDSFKRYNSNKQSNGEHQSLFENAINKED